jgi:hypothetical protein
MPPSNLTLEDIAFRWLAGRIFVKAGLAVQWALSMVLL